MIDAIFVFSQHALWESKERIGEVDVRILGFLYSLILLVLNRFKTNVFPVFFSQKSAVRLKIQQAPWKYSFPAFCWLCVLCMLILGKKCRIGQLRWNCFWPAM